ncbi:MAG TPA: nitroreductase family protein [Rhodocyclaceae bacterium]
MDVSKAIEQRRAVKAYDPSHKMTEAEIERLLSLAMLAPTAWNIQHWRFVVVQDPELRQQIRAAAWGQAQVTDASLLVIMTADLNAWQKNPARYFEGADDKTKDWLLSSMHQFYNGREWLQRDDAVKSCAIAAMTLMLAAQEMGYDSCPMDGFDFDAVAKLINMPKDHVITMFVAIGKAAAPARPRSGKLAMSEAVVRDRFV